MNKLKSSAKHIALTPVDDLFSSEESRADANRERVVELPLTELHPFQNHPFKVLDDDKMQDTAQSIREHGVLVPAIVRPREDDGYEIVSGHRRHRASRIAGLDTMPAIIRDLDDDAATIIMVDSNLQRESILPSERARAYRMKLEVLKRQGKRSDLLSDKLRCLQNTLKGAVKMTEMQYTIKGDYQVPNLIIPQQSGQPLNKYGRMRAKYLEEQRPILYQTMLLNGTLTSHLQEISETASCRLEQMMQEMAKAANMTEELKASDPMDWTQQMNILKAQAEEILLAELIYR